jgi:hypothetical protein
MANLIPAFEFVEKSVGTTIVFCMIVGFGEVSKIMYEYDDSKNWRMNLSERFSNISHPLIHVYQAFDSPFFTLLFLRAPFEILSPDSWL